MKPFCIVGTDTTVGKTVVAAGISTYFQKKKLNFDVQKWISTGDKEGISQDLLFIFHSLQTAEDEQLCFNPLLAKLKKKVDFMYRNPYSFKYAASPHLAAKLENRRIKVEVIERAIEYFRSHTDFLIIEGIGGLKVPVSEKILLIDLIKKYNLPVVLVSPNVLGTINKTILSIEILNEYGIENLGIIYNNYFKEDKKIQDDNIQIINKFSKAKILGEIGRIESKLDLAENFKDIGRKLLLHLKKYYKEKSPDTASDKKS